MKSTELSLEEAYQKLYKFIYHYIINRCHCSESTADTITSDVFYELHLKWASLQSHNEKVITAWVLRAAPIMIKSHNRKNARNLQLLEENTEDILDNLASDENIIQDIEETQRYEVTLRTIRSGLTPSEWELFQDNYIQQISNDELAKKYKITNHALEQRRSRLKKKLKEILSKPRENC